MKRPKLYAVLAVLLGLSSALIYGGCGYYDEFFDNAYRNAIGTCPPNEDTAGGCKRVYECDLENSWTWTADDKTWCKRPDDADDLMSGKCENGECKPACVVDGNCECSDSKPCGEVECYDAVCNSTFCKYTLKMPSQDGEVVNCKLADETTDGYCKMGTCTAFGNAGAACSSEGVCASGICSNGKCVECTDSDRSQCNVGPEPYCHNGTCASCSNETKDGDETGIDCGPFSRCGRCNGSLCGSGDHCSSKYCADSVCCENACDKPCHACNRSKAWGECKPIDPGRVDICQDTDGTDETTPGCNKDGHCEQSGGDWGTCKQSTDCLSGNCFKLPANSEGYCTPPP